MTTDTALPEPSAPEAGARQAVRMTAAWRLALMSWGGLVLGIILLFWRDSADMFGIWWNNTTYQHCLLIPPIIAYLVWQRKAELLALSPRPFLPAAIFLAIGGLGWLLGDLAGVALVRHTAIVGMLIVSVPLVFGLTVTRGLTFPLFYALFMIPVGDQLVPWLQMITADMCIWLLDVFDVPAYIDGVFITIPNGAFEVAEACSGVRFLIAMTAFSTLVAHLCFRSTLRRVICVVSAIILAILANGVRAWGTIYISHLTTQEFAAGVDHVIYGWFFFAIIMAILLGIGWFFFDRPVDDPAFDPAKLEKSGRLAAAPKAFVAAAVAGLISLAAAPAWSALVADRDPDSITARIEMPDVPGWTKVSHSGSDWRPLYDNASASAWQGYEDSKGRKVDLFIAVYDRQSEDAEMIAYGNGLMEPDGDWSWAQNLSNPPQGRGVQLQRSPWTRDIWQYYLVGDEVTGSEYRAKIATLKTKLLGGPTRAAAMVVSVERSAGDLSGEPAMADFMTALGEPADVVANAAASE